MLSARDLTLRRGPEPLFEHVNFTVYRGNKVGITGANGTGKSSLIAAILGELAPDGGDIDRPAGLKIAHVEQEIAASNREAIEFVLDGDAELRGVLAAIADAQDRDAPMALAESHASLQAIDGYRATSRAASIMHGLGFKTADHRRSVAEFSGGWRVRLAMARALCSRADLLLLDEPTNHLDLDAIIWLEDWLMTFPGTLLMISHDREFLDAIIDRVLHIENRGIHAYSGNYSQFEEKRAEELALQRVLKARQTRRVAEITAFVNRFRASATKSRQAQSRLKMLERMERIVPAHVDSPFEFEFAPPLKTPRPLLTIEDGACGHGNTRIVSHVNVSIGPLDRIALLGPNGAGKSTLTKMRDALGRFGFEGDRAFEAVGRFSGGEKARLTLALLVARRPNLLLLDEPTNHLDIDMREALTVALQSFEGGMLIVSHDRHLIKTVADTLWLVDGGKLETFEGDLDDYQQSSRLHGKAEAAAVRKEAPPRDVKTASRAAPKGASGSRGRLAEMRREIDQIEKRLVAIDAERTLVEAELCKDPMDGALQARHADLTRNAAVMETRWLEVGTAIETAEAEIRRPG